MTAARACKFTKPWITAAFGPGLVTSSYIDQDREQLVKRFRDRDMRRVVPATASKCGLPTALFAVAQAAGQLCCSLPMPAIPVLPAKAGFKACAAHASRRFCACFTRRRKS